MKLEPMALGYASFIMDDSGTRALAAGDTATLQHLLNCRAYLRILVATARQPEHFGILERAERMLNGFMEPAPAPAVGRGAPFDEPIPAVDMETLRLTLPLIPGMEY